MPANAVKANNLIYHKDCVPEEATNRLAINVNEDETCSNCGKNFEVVDVDVEDREEEKADDESSALGKPGTFDPNDALRPS